MNRQDTIPDVKRKTKNSYHVVLGYYMSELSNSLKPTTLTVEAVNKGAALVKVLFSSPKLPVVIFSDPDMLKAQEVEKIADKVILELYDFIIIPGGE